MLSSRIDSAAMLGGLVAAVLMSIVAWVGAEPLGQPAGYLTIAIAFLLSLLAISRPCIALVRRVDGALSRSARTAYIAILLCWFVVPYLVDGAPTSKEVRMLNRTSVELFGQHLVFKLWALSYLNFLLGTLGGLVGVAIAGAVQYLLRRTVSREILSWLLLLSVTNGLFYVALRSLSDWVLD